MKATIEVAGTTHDVQVLGDGRIRVDGQAIKPGAAELIGANAQVGGRTLGFRVLDVALAVGGARRGPTHVRAPMHGKLVAIPVASGQAVRAGDVLFVLEAMKMQNEVKAPSAGTVRSVAARPGDVVESGKVLLELEPTA